jgi:hypothetical protein
MYGSGSVYPYSGGGASAYHNPPPAQAPSRPGGTVYGRGGATAAPPPAESTPGLRNVGGPVGTGAGNPSQAYYPGQQAPHFPAPNPLESSGSLTGHILSRGRADTPTPKSRTARVVIIMVVVLAVVVGLGFLAATVFNDFLSNLLGGLTDG